MSGNALDDVDHPAGIDRRGRRRAAADQSEQVTKDDVVRHAARCRDGPAADGEPLAAHGVEIVLRLQDDAERLTRRSRRRANRVRARSAPPPSRASRTRRGPCRAVRAAVPGPAAVTCAASRAGAWGTRALTIASSFSNDGIGNPLIQAAALQRVVHFARAVRREDHERRFGCADRAELGNRDLKFGEQLEQVALELLVGAIDLVDQQNGGPRARRIDRLQQRPLDQERFAVELATRPCRDRVRRSTSRMRSSSSCRA